jgi:hypothetical protein
VAGGALADRYDPTGASGRGVRYHDSGRSYVAPGSTAQFVSWCRPFSCRAIVTLPGEINDPRRAAAACRTCSIARGVDEFAVGRGAGLDPFLGGFALVPYVAAELVEGIETGVSSMEYWMLPDLYPNGLPYPSTSTPLVDRRFAAVLHELPERAIATVASTVGGGAFVPAFEAANGTSAALFVVTANTTFTVRPNLGAAGFPVGASGTLVPRNSSAGTPATRSFLAPALGRVPPESLRLWVSTSGAWP